MRCFSELVYPTKGSNPSFPWLTSGPVCGTPRGQGLFRGHIARLNPKPYRAKLVTYAESIAWLYGTQLFGIKLGLESSSHLLLAAGINPAAPGVPVIHVAGTNGKGSVCAFAERILRDSGLQTGLFTSPHLVHYRERIRVNGVPISEGDCGRKLSDLHTLVSHWDPHPTFFEISLALAMRHFIDEACEVIILETGMGGRLDATNAIQAQISVITSISLDHQQWLGETLREIAVEKAGIMKPDTPVIVADLAPEARDVVGRRALSLGIPFLEAHPLPEDWKLGLRGPHQRENAALAVETACRIDSARLTQEGIRASLAAANWPGRFQAIGNRLILDGAHNPDAAQVLTAAWQEEFPGEKAHLVFGAVSSKDISGVLTALGPIMGEITFVPLKSERGLATEVLRESYRLTGLSPIPIQEAASCVEALSLAASSSLRTLITGSLYLVGEALALLNKGEFETSLQ
jgi:dihydrofolate synthase / folylpolyglutamate synthase